MSKKITQKEIESLIMEELQNLDEGVWDKIKGTFAGVGSALTSPLGSVGQGYKRGKAASALKTAAMDVMKVRKEFVNNIEGLFKTPFAKVIKLDPSMKDVVTKWNAATDKMDGLGEELQKLSMEVKVLSKSGTKDQLKVSTGEEEPTRDRDRDDDRDRDQSGTSGGASSTAPSIT